MRVHWAWVVAGVSFVALVGAASFRAAPGALIEPLRAEFGWSTATISLAISINLLLFGLTAPFAAALMDKFGVRIVVTCALTMVAIGSGLTVFMTASWQLVLLWGVVVGLGTGSMALAFVATITGRWFVKHRGLVTGVLTAGGAAGQLVFLPLVAVAVRVLRLAVRVAGDLHRRAGRRAAGGVLPARVPRVTSVCCRSARPRTLPRRRPVARLAARSGR